MLEVGTKSDLVRDATKRYYDFQLSTVSGEGVDELLGEIGRRAAVAAPSQGDLLPWRQRHVELLMAAQQHLACAASGAASPIELRCEELRAAADAIGRIAGHVDVEDLLDVIFSQFCIGK